MALNYKSGTETQQTISATTSSTTIDLVGYSQLAVHTRFGVCSGTANGLNTLTIQTSMDNSNWVNICTISSAAANVVDHNGLEFFDYLPDHTAAIATPPVHNVGFGRYVKFTFTATDTFSVSYVIKWLAKG